MAISITTFNTIGLGVAACFAGLSVLAIVNPRQVDDLFGVTHQSPLGSAKAGDAAAAATSTVDYTSLGTLIGGRDLAIGVSIYCLGKAGRNKEMGTVILSTMCLAIPDIWLAWRNKKYPETLVLSLTTIAVAIVGFNLRG